MLLHKSEFIFHYYQDASIKCGVCNFPGRAVNTSTPVSVTTMVCSNWADSFPSWTIRLLQTFNISSHPHLSDAGPVVWPGLVAPHALVDHWLDGEAVAGLHHAHSLVLGVVRDVRGAVEQSETVVIVRNNQPSTTSSPPQKDLLVNSVPTI